MEVRNAPTCFPDDDRAMPVTPATRVAPVSTTPATPIAEGPAGTEPASTGWVAGDGARARVVPAPVPGAAGPSGSIDANTQRELDAAGVIIGEAEKNPGDKASSAMRVRTVVAQALTQAQRPDLSKAARAHWYLKASVGEILIQQKLGGSLDDAKASFAHLHAAAGLAPDNRDVAVNFGRVVRGMAQQNRAVRFFINFGLGIDVMKEAARSANMLKPFADDAVAQLYRADLAQAVGDTAGQEDANAALRTLPPNVVQAARASLDADNAKAKGLSEQVR